MRLTLHLFGREVVDLQLGAEPEAEAEDTQPDVVSLPGYFLDAERGDNRVGFVLPANDWED